MSICNLQWTISPPSNCAYAAAALLRGIDPADSARSSELAGHVDLLRQTTGRDDDWLDQLFTHLAPLYATPEGTRYVVDTALRKVTGNVDANLVDVTTAAVQGLLNAWEESFPTFENDAKLRGAVLEQHWAARGPGLLSSIERFTDDDLISPQVTVLLVEPLFGGGGSVYLPYNAVAIEAVLANPHDDLPEIVRLAWMIAQLHMDAPVHSETIHGNELPRLAALAALPPTLMAAEIVELVQFSPKMAQRAIEAWHIPVDDSQQAANTVVSWWKVYQRERPRWSVALAGLQGMLP
ncbi:MAG: hypothetical protein WBF93_10985 [Pirellulales bacterium]|nr:hypothetical protein [Pirellulales bacterium]